MVQDYPILRLRQVDNKLECELTNPTAMQITGIDLKMSQKSKKVIQKHYSEIVRMTGGKDQTNVKEFERKLKTLGQEIGEILQQVLRGLAFEVKKGCNLALALDDETVKIPWELGLLPRSLTRGKQQAFFLRNSLYRKIASS